jgi:hypothetical protein
MPHKPGVGLLLIFPMLLHCSPPLFPDNEKAIGCTMEIVRSGSQYLVKFTYSGRWHNPFWSLFSPAPALSRGKSTSWSRLVAFLFCVFGFFDSLVGRLSLSKNLFQRKIQK